MTNNKTILLLTSGGLAPALNATLYGAIKAARKKGYKVLGGVNGWNSLVENGKIVNLTKINIESIKNRGGNFLRSSRTNPFKAKNGLNNLKSTIKKYKINTIIAIGGDDTLSAAAKLYKQEKIPVIGLPKTIDNDLPKTYFSPGFPSAAYYIAKLVSETKEDSAYALSRVFIIEIMGAKSGWLTCSAALGGADIVIPPEWEFNLETILNKIKKKYKQNNNLCVIGLSKEAKIKGLAGIADKQIDFFNNKRKEFVSLSLQKKIQSKLGLNTKTIVPMSYLQSGEPINLDKKFGFSLGKKGIEMVTTKKYGQTAIIDYKNGKFNLKEVKLSEFLNGTKKMNNTWFNKKTMQPTDKYFKYLKTLIGDFDFIDKDYNRLQKLVNKK